MVAPARIIRVLTPVDLARFAIWLENGREKTLRRVLSVNVGRRRKRECVFYVDANSSHCALGRSSSSAAA